MGSFDSALGTNRTQTVGALVEVIDAEVADQSGLSGAAVKAAYAAARRGPIA